MEDVKIYNPGINPTSFKINLTAGMFQSRDMVFLTGRYGKSMIHKAIRKLWTEAQEMYDKDLLKFVIYMTIRDGLQLYMKIKYEDSYHRRIETLRVGGEPIKESWRYENILLDMVEPLIEELRDEIKHETAIIKIRLCGGCGTDVRYYNRVKILVDGKKTIMKKGLLSIKNFNKDGNNRKDNTNT